MIEALLSFLGGTAFRMIWGEVSSWMNKRLEHDQEMQRLSLSARLEGERHARDLERMKQAHDFGLKEIQVSADAAVSKLEAEAFVTAMKDAYKPTGIQWVDAWNGAIRPLTATIAILLWVGALVAQGFQMTEWDTSLVGVVIGFFFADRSLGKRGK